MSASMTEAQRALTCIRCPRGCEVTVTLDPKGTITSVSGQSCPRGDSYARNEITDPRRTVTSTVRVVTPGFDAAVSVKTAGEVPKAKVLEVAQALSAIELTPPIRIGDLVCSDICGTGVDVIATSNHA